MRFNVDQLLIKMKENEASDLHITVGIPPIMRIDGELIKVADEVVYADDTKDMVESLLSNEQKEQLRIHQELDICISRPNIGRFRLNAFVQRGSYAIVLRYVHTNIPEFEILGLPQILSDISNRPKGLFLVTGPTGSGKSTTLAAMISMINRQRSCHVLTLEDPIEYLYKHEKSIINQREIRTDTKSFGNGLRAALREDPDVILIGEMRDLETISIALSAAETGHLVLSTLHTMGSAKTIDRIIDVFPPSQQQQIRIQLSTALIGIMSQVLIPRIDKKGRICAYELMIANPAIRNLIRENKTHQVNSIMQMCRKEGMNTIENRLEELYKAGMISKEDVITHSIDIESISKMFK
jgi:twitching motility protein PilT